MKTKAYSNSIQIWAMNKRFPHFKVKRNGKTELEFRGWLKVKPELPKYYVKVLYRGSRSPIVEILTPKLLDNAPHVYQPMQNLCLYHPSNFKWRKEKLISNEIMGWTCAWIYFYEVWLETSEWIGPEVLHIGAKDRVV